MTHELARVKNERCRILLIQNLFNLCRVNAGSLIVSHRDTEYEYLISTDQRLTKAQLAAAQQFSAGFIAAFNAMF